MYTSQWVHVACTGTVIVGMPLVFYCAVAEALRKLEKKQGSLKSIVFSRPDANSKKVYALACQTLKR